MTTTLKVINLAEFQTPSGRPMNVDSAIKNYLYRLNYSNKWINAKPERRKKMNETSSNYMKTVVKDKTTENYKRFQESQNKYRSKIDINAYNRQTYKIRTEKKRQLIQQQHEQQHQLNSPNSESESDSD